MHADVSFPTHLSRTREVVLLVVAVALSAMFAGCTDSELMQDTVPGPGAGAVPEGQPASGLEQRTSGTLPAVPQAAASPTPLDHLLAIDVPEPGQWIYSPVYVRGTGLVPSERTLEVQVLSVNGEILGRRPLLFDTLTSLGENAAFEGTLHFRQPEQQQLGSVRVLMKSPRDDSLVDYAQVLVVLRSAGMGAENITIDTPTAGTLIGNPVRVQGTAVAPQNQITVRLVSGAAVLTSDTVPLTGAIGEVGQFSVDLVYELFSALGHGRPGYPAPSQQVAGHIEVFYRSPKDGRIAEIASVPVIIPLSP